MTTDTKRGAPDQGAHAQTRASIVQLSEVSCTDFTPSHEALIRQRVLVLGELRLGPRSTDEFRAMGVRHPGGRIAELRAAGRCIKTLRVRGQSGQATYVLVPGGAA